MAKRPVIGLSCDVRLEERTLHFVFGSYVESVERAGGLPLAIPAADPATVPQILETVDAIVIVGGEDLDPSLWGEEPLPTHEPVPSFRERFDLALALALLASHHPVLGVCYGCQLLAVAAGGSLHQDLPTGVGGDVRHGGGTYPDLPHHDVAVTPDTRLRRILGADRVEVNSAHHQAPRSLGDGLIACALAPDGVIEAIEAPTDRFLLGVMWHPELMPDRPEQRRLFGALVDAASGGASGLDRPPGAR
jgi:putative glutamine amidotransferase